MSGHCLKHRAAVSAATAVAFLAMGSGGAYGAPPAGSEASPVHASAPAGTLGVVPAVDTFQAAPGGGWSPAAGARVVIAGSSPALADEGRLLAGELGMAYGGTAAPGTGDVSLALSTTGSKTPESYGIVTTPDQVAISGPDEAGVFYGTRTLKQAVRGTGTMPAGTVTDGPAKPQRGLNLDIARKYFTPDWIEDRLREMADLKLNQLGLHFSDDQGLGIETMQAKYQPIVTRQHLTQAQLADIIALARSLHITVVPEIDSPGHLSALLKAFPAYQLLDVRGRPVQGAIDIANPGSGPLVDGLLEEFLPLFPGNAWHLGGDEYQALARRNPSQAFPGLAAAAANLEPRGGTIQDLATTWLNDRAKVIAPSGKQLKAWNDGFYPGTVQANPDIEAEYWTGKEIGARPPEEYLAEGRKVVNLNDAFLYYVLGEPNEFTYPTGQAIYQQWTPSVLRGTKPAANAGAHQDQILGARLAVWCDQAGAQTQQQVAAGIRMPMAALSQKVWDAGRPPLDWAGFTRLVGTVALGSQTP